MEEAESLAFGVGSLSKRRRVLGAAPQAGRTRAAACSQRRASGKRDAGHSHRNDEE